MSTPDETSRRRLIGLAALGAGAAPAGVAALGLRANQISAGSTASVEPSVAGYSIGLQQFSGTVEQRFLTAIDEAGEVRDDALGQTVDLPRGVIPVTRPFNLKNRVSIRGVNKRGSVIRAARGHEGPWMATAANGRLSSFDNSLSHLTLDCQDILGLGGVDSTAWQEGGGLRNVLVNKFRTVGVRFREGFGGASTCLIRESEIFGSAAGSATAGVRVDRISGLGGFLLHIADTTITGGAGVPMAYGVDIENDSLLCHTVHFEEVRSAIHLNGVGNHVLIGVTGADTVGVVVEIHRDFQGSLMMIGCARSGAGLLVRDRRAGGFGEIPYDVPFFRIGAQPDIALGANAAGGNFNGALRTPNIDKCFGVTRIAKTAAGTYDVTMLRPGSNANSFSVIASTNLPGGTVDCMLRGGDSVRLISRNASGQPVDANELKFLVTRVA